jgi:hypothetical protein
MDPARLDESRTSPDLLLTACTVIAAESACINKNRRLPALPPDIPWLPGRMRRNAKIPFSTI